MIRANEITVQWLWVDHVTNVCFPETMSSTEDYAAQRAQQILGKRRMAGGEVRAVRVTIEPMSAEETAAQRAEFESWKARKDAERSRSSSERGAA